MTCKGYDPKATKLSKATKRLVTLRHRNHVAKAGTIMTSREPGMPALCPGQSLFRKHIRDAINVTITNNRKVVRDKKETF